MAGRAPAPHERPPCGPERADRRRRPGRAGGRRDAALRRDVPAQGRGHPDGRVPRAVGHVDEPRGAVLHVAGRVPVVGAAQGGGAAGGAAADGAAAGGHLQPAAVAAAGGGRAVAGDGGPAAGPRGHARRRRPGGARTVRVRRRQRHQLHGPDGRRHEQARHRGELPPAGGPAAAADAEAGAPDPDHPPGRARAARRQRLLLAAPSAQLPVADAPHGLIRN